MLILLGGCAPHYDGPRPVLMPPDKYRENSHWECPAGYTTRYYYYAFTDRKVVYCVSKAGEVKREEQDQRSFEPKP